MALSKTSFGIGLLTGLAVAGALSLGWRRGDDRDVARYREVRDWVTDHYVRDVREGDLLDNALHGMVERLDGYSRFYDSSQVAALDRDTTGEYRGIGVVFRAPLREPRVLFTLPDSPAQRAGLRPGDHVLRINGRPTASMAAGEFQSELSADPKASVVLEVRGRDGAVTVHDIERSELVDPTVRHAQLLDVERGIAYLAILSFSVRTPEEFDRCIDGLRAQGMRALVIDLRGNLGGVLHSAVRVANRFIEQGLIVSTEGRGEPVRYEAARAEASLAGLPLALIVDADTASASEVLAGALQDHRRAALVGGPTYGKGMVQKVHAFGGDEAEVKLTTAYYYTPSHTNIERSVQRGREHGLVPDLRVELDREQAVLVRGYLATYSPPAEAMAELRAWEAAEGLSLIEVHPRDAQLEAAVALFRGERPGPQPLAKTP